MEKILKKVEREDSDLALKVMKEIVLVVCENLMRKNDKYLNTLISNWVDEDFFCRFFLH